MSRVLHSSQQQLLMEIRAMGDTAATDQPKLQAVPATWPGAFGLYKYSRDAVMFNIRTILLGVVAILAVYLGYSIVDSVLKLPQAVDGILKFLFNVYVLLVETIIYFAGVDRQRISLTEAMTKAKSYLWQGIILAILCYLIAIGSLLVLVIPFFFIAPRLALVPFYLIRQNLDATAAISASWKQTKGNLGKVYGLVGVNILIVLLSLTIVGIPFTIYFGIMYGAAFNLLYVYLAEKGKAA